MKRKQKRAYGGKALKMITPAEAIANRNIENTRALYEAEKAAAPYGAISDALIGMGSQLIGMNMQQNRQAKEITGENVNLNYEQPEPNFNTDIPATAFSPNASKYQLPELSVNDFGMGNPSLTNRKNKTFDYVPNTPSFATGGEIGSILGFGLDTLGQSSNNKFLQGASKFSSLLPMVGGIFDAFSESSGQLNPYDTQMRNKANNDASFAYRFASGGNVPIEAEGQEIVQEPTGEMYELQGPSHEQGGIDMQVPEGSQIYSKRLRGADGKTMAERKAFREKRLAKLEALVKRNPNDKILKRTFEKTQKDFAKQEQEDMAYMNYMHQSQQMQQGQEEILDPMQGALGQEDMFAMGGPAKRAVRPIKYKSKLYNPRGEYRVTDDIENPGFIINQPKRPHLVNGMPESFNPEQPINQDYEAYYDEDGNVRYKYLKSTVPSIATPGIVESQGQTVSNTNTNNKDGQSNNGDDESFWNKAYDALPTLGDAINLYGKYKAAYDPADMTLANRAGDTPNINPYENYGIRGLNKMEDVKNNLKNNLDQTVLNNQKNTNLYKANAASNARSINTMRAMNLASEAQQLAADNAAYMQYAQQVAGIDSKIAQMMNQQDQMQMMGNWQRDIADRQDRDNFNKQLQQDIATRNKGIQEIGKTINDWKERDFNFNVVNQTSKDFKLNKNGTISAKGNESTWTPEKRYWNGKQQSEYDNYLKNYKTKGYFIEGDTMYNSEGKEVEPNNHYAVVPNGKEFDLSGKKKAEKEAKQKAFEADNVMSLGKLSEFYNNYDEMAEAEKAYLENSQTPDGKKYAKYLKAKEEQLKELKENFSDYIDDDGEYFTNFKGITDYVKTYGKMPSRSNRYPEVKFNSFTNIKDDNGNKFRTSPDGKELIGNVKTGNKIQQGKKEVDEVVTKRVNEGTIKGLQLMYTSEYPDERHVNLFKVTNDTTNFWYKLSGGKLDLRLEKKPEEAIVKYILENYGK